MSIEAMKLALRELEYVLESINYDKVPFDDDDFHETMRLLHQAIEQAEKQEPVAWIRNNGFRFDADIEPQEDGIEVPLYTTPPQREWVGLTDDDIAQLRRAGAHSVSDKDFRAIEAKLKEKNT